MYVLKFSACKNGTLMTVTARLLTGRTLSESRHRSPSTSNCCVVFLTVFISWQVTSS